MEERIKLIKEMIRKYRVENFNVEFYNPLIWIDLDFKIPLDLQEKFDKDLKVLAEEFVLISIGFSFKKEFFECKITLEFVNEYGADILYLYEEFKNERIQ